MFKVLYIQNKYILGTMAERVGGKAGPNCYYR